MLLKEFCHSPALLYLGIFDPSGILAPVLTSCSRHVPAALFPGHRMATQGQGAEMSVLMEGPYLGHGAQPGPAPRDSRPARLDSGCLAMGK